MKLSADPPVHLTYCLNIHPGETWAENLAAIRDHALRVRDKVAPGRAFGLGLRLSRRAADELAQPPRLGEFRQFLDAHGLYVFTVNGFPYGPFHGTAVKRDVYQPDWRTAERRDYTVRLIDVLAALLPEGVTGSISTVPGAYKASIRTAADVERMSRMLIETAVHAAAVRRQTGRLVTIALEPEPDCFIETTDEAIGYLTGDLRAGAQDDEARQVLAEHVAVCLDTAHAAVEFEDPSEALRRLDAAGVGVGKVQLSAALRLRPTPRALERLGAFRDAVYLHQVKVRSADGRIRSYADLPEALSAGAGSAGEEWRVHFHVPLFFAGAGGLESTGPLLSEEFFRRARGLTPHLEVETYTFNVLPAELRAADVADSIARELSWALERLGG